MLACANINCQHAGLDIQYHTCVLCESGLIYNNTTMNLSVPNLNRWINQQQKYEDLIVNA
jgi:hypothetical protein